jgi:hypothetical protein
MTEQELLSLRQQKWHLDNRPVHTLEEAREFIDSVGFCLMYPLERQPLLVPTFIGAWVGRDDHLPVWQHAFTDPRAQSATELMVRLLREKAAFEANLFGENVFLVSASVFPFLYGLVGDRNPRQALKQGHRSGDSPLARDAFDALRQQGAMTKPRLREVLGREPSSAALDRALAELGSRLLITRVDYNPDEGGASWNTLFRWAPEVVREGIELSVPAALSALICKYLDCLVAAELTEVVEFLGHFVARSKVNEAVNALLAARELSFVQVENGSKLQVAPPRLPPVPSFRRDPPKAKP